MFNIPPTAKVICGDWVMAYRVSFDRLEERWVELGTPGYKTSGLSTTPWYNVDHGYI